MICDVIVNHMEGHVMGFLSVMKTRERAQITDAIQHTAKMLPII